MRSDITTTFSDNEADQLTSESWSGGTLNTWNVNPVYDTKLRRNQLRVNKNAVLQIQHDYGYDNASRLRATLRCDWNELFAGCDKV